MTFPKIGITEYCDAYLNNSWEKWVLKDNKPAILITKNIKRLLEKYPGLENLPNVILHATITGYGSSFIEPNVPHPKDLLDFMADKNKSRITLRIDPIIPIEKFIDRSFQVFTEGVLLCFPRIRISILDLYPHVLKRLDKYHELQYELKNIYNWDASHSIDGQHKEYMIHAPLTLRQQIIHKFEVPTEFLSELEICCEPGIKSTSCVSKKDLEIFGIKLEKRYPKNEQREFCSCLGIKKQFGLLKDSCSFGCLYCYKNN